MPEPPPASEPLASADLIGRVDLEAARQAIAGVAVRTPTIACEDLSEAAGSLHSSRGYALINPNLPRKF